MAKRKKKKKNENNKNKNKVHSGEPQAPKRIIEPQRGILMPLSPFERRMSQLSAQALPPPWHPAADLIKKRMEKLAETDITLQQEIKERWRRICYWGFTRAEGGSGFLMSRTLRSYFLEYFRRISNHGLHSLPPSFNVVESFLSYRKEYLAFDLRSEIEHLLDPDDYFKWYSASDMPKDPMVLRDVMREGVAYSYDMIADASGYRISTPHSTLVIAGVSFVLHDNELSCLLVAGEQPPSLSDTAAAELTNADYETPPGKENLVSDPSIKIKDRYLDTFPGYARVILLTRFDLRAKKHDVRYVNVDLGSSFKVLTDDSSVLGQIHRNKLQGFRQHTLEGLTAYNELFSALTSLIYLPIMFVAESKFVHEKKFATELSTKKDEDFFQEAIKELGEKEFVFSRTIRCLATSAKDHAGGMETFCPPDLEFHTEGYWKTIPAGEVGEDKTGNPIFGKTWVERKDTWSAQSPKSFILKRPKVPVCGAAPGTIYVLKSPANHVDTFKIGLTRRTADKRARELSSTGVPLPLDVIVKWEVGDCVKVEKEVHKRLEVHRVSMRREFFKVSISEIIATVQSVIADLESGD